MIFIKQRLAPVVGSPVMDVMAHMYNMYNLVGLGGPSSVCHFGLYGLRLHFS